MAAIILTDWTGAKVTVGSEEQAARWEARGYTREKPAASAPRSRSKKKTDD